MSSNENSEAETRIQALIQERNAARSDLQEARAEIASLTEAGAANTKSVEAAVNAARAEMQSKVTELEGQLRRTTNRSLLLADKIPEDGMDDVLSYLDYQYGKLEPDADGAKPEFADWYKEARKTNKVLRAAMKPSVAARAAADSEEEVAAVAEPAPKAASTRVAIPAKPTVVPVKPGDTGKEIDISKLKLGTAEYAAAKQRVKQLAFPSARQ
jgi:hypothetical protein